MTDIARVRDLIISLSRSWHPSREQVQRIVDAAQGVENVMLAPDASTVTEEAVEAAARAIASLGFARAVTDEEWQAQDHQTIYHYRRQAYAALTALPHLTAAKDAEIERLRNAMVEIVLLCNVSHHPWHWIDVLLRIDAKASAALESKS